jgi:hypothetical protein
MHEQAEILGTWLTGAMQSIAGLQYLGKTLQDEVRIPQTGPRLAREIWKRFSETRDPVVQPLRQAILARFNWAWHSKSLGRFRIISLTGFAKQVEIPEEVISAHLGKILNPLAKKWPPQQPKEFLLSPQVQEWLEELVMREATGRARQFDWPKVFVAAWSWLTSAANQDSLDIKNFATEDDFRAYLARVVRDIAQLDRQSDLDKPETLFKLASLLPRKADY